MMRSKTVIAVALLTGLAAGSARAQASAAGTWNTEFDIGIRNENGVETSMGKRKATMTLTLKGDSVLGVWQVAPDSTGRKPAPVALMGVRSGAKLTIASEPVERTVRINDEEQRVKIVTTYYLELRGDELVGNSELKSAEHIMERPFLAKRQKM